MKTKRLAFCMLITILMTSATSALTVRPLPANEYLRPVGWSGGLTVQFMAGQVSVDDEDGGVTIGILAANHYLRPWNWKDGTVEFNAGGTIRFERAGGVKEGDLAKDTYLRIVGQKSISWSFARGSRVEFGYDGGVMRGTLVTAATLTDAQGVTRTYPPGTAVTFNEKGEVVAANAPGLSAGETVWHAYTGGVIGSADENKALYEATLIFKTEDGKTSGTIEFVSGGSGLERLSDVVLDQNSVRFTRPGVPQYYSGDISNGNKIKGVFDHMNVKQRWWAEKQEKKK